MGAWLYIVQCSDRSYYTGTTRGDLEHRIAQHQAGTFDGYTATRRPVVVKYSEYFDRITDAIAAEQQIKRWSRAKKEALMSGDFVRISRLSERRTPFPRLTKEQVEEVRRRRADFASGKERYVTDEELAEFWKKLGL